MRPQAHYDTRCISLVLLLFTVVLAGCGQRNLQPITLLSPTGQQIKLLVELADEPEERSRGLMFREELPMGQGMLFVFDKPQILSFWMKNTRIPLDILFFDAAGKLVSTTTMEPCKEDPCPIYPSAAEAEYALEVPAGFVRQYGIGEGWSLFPLPSPRQAALACPMNPNRIVLRSCSLAQLILPLPSV